MHITLIKCGKLMIPHINRANQLICRLTRNSPKYLTTKGDYSTKEKATNLKIGLSLRDRNPWISDRNQRLFLRYKNHECRSELLEVIRLSSGFEKRSELGIPQEKARIDDLQSGARIMSIFWVQAIRHFLHVSNKMCAVWNVYWFLVSRGD
ncbi:hypothetical protein CEXT_359541 [Caerostris extrusa]|uniref:Uncharacterized protein n=1 Tax=Caerostris extrusa TaxID=172846 RepID=A0AAV4XDX7_CAEEX|nr:hypothetical protein CEXT_359541 [Caerostris extrusa]